MSNKEAALDFSLKTYNMCRYLIDEKGETLLSCKLFAESVAISSMIYSLENPSLTKAELAAVKKEASSKSNAVLLYLDMLLMSGHISDAQKQSVLQTLRALRKAANI